MDLGFLRPETEIGIFENEFSEIGIEIFEIGIFENEILKMRFSKVENEIFESRGAKCGLRS